MSAAAPEIDADLSTIAHLDFDHEVPCASAGRHRGDPPPAAFRVMPTCCDAPQLLCQDCLACVLAWAARPQGLLHQPCRTIVRTAQIKYRRL